MDDQENPTTDPTATASTSNPTPNRPTPTTDTTGTRRVKYGLNVAVAVIAATLIVVLINWISYRQFYRFDFTATRRYSLSQQTHKLLSSLEGQYQLVTLFSGSNTFRNQAQDLVTEYARYSSAITVDHIGLNQITRLENFYQTLHQRYDTQLQPIISALENARQTLEQVRLAITDLRAPLLELHQDPALGESALQQLIQQVVQALGRSDSEIKSLDEQTQQTLTGPLPNYTGVRTSYQNLLTNLDQNILAIALDQFSQAAHIDTTPDSVKDKLLQINQAIRPVRSQIQAALPPLRAAQPIEGYEQLSTQLANADTIVLIGPKQVQVLPLTDMFRQPNPNQLQPGQQPQLRFQGEEKITGALVSMTLEHRPMVVFINAGQQPALGPQGQFEQIAQRLRNMNFQVHQWSPVGQPSRMGQPTPAAAPQPLPGQKAVWVFLPVPPPNPRNPMGVGNEQQILAQLQQRLDANEPAMVMLAPSPMSRFGSADPIADVLKPWGITPQIDRIILSQVNLPDHRTRAIAQIEVNRWPADLPITQALAGMPGIFLEACPLVLGNEQTNNVQLWPLVELHGSNLWAERDLQSFPNVQPDPTTQADSFIIAAAAQKGDNRLVVVTSPSWATDQITTYGPLGPGTAEVFGSMFPGNAELFVNSVYWLADLDQLIAASARSQDIRRIEPFSYATLVSLRWALLLGMPLAAIAAGVSVWSIRRRV